MTTTSGPERPTRNIAARVLSALRIWKKGGKTGAASKPARTNAAPAKKHIKTPPRKEPAVPARKKTPSDFPLCILPSDINLVGQAAFSCEVEGKRHALAFKTDGLYIDGLKYKLLAQSTFGDTDMSIRDVRRFDELLRIQADAWGKKESIELKGDDLTGLMQLLLQRRQFTAETDDGMIMRIERQMY